ncbi:hypothetical protein C5167_046401 [Papaver somniferum]|uniref:Uncharacterized protein n=1 Tax=Papaver somniferum TaxID=3469 RepID=A0A4Y7LDN9_PAPSO|nr:hypothetical protein C5167_046401 [Papaver somniferum]
METGEGMKKGKGVEVVAVARECCVQKVRSGAVAFSWDEKNMVKLELQLRWSMVMCRLSWCCDGSDEHMDLN